MSWALLNDDIPTGHGARFNGLANLATAGASVLAGLFRPVTDRADALLPAGTYRLSFSLAALVSLAAHLPLLEIGTVPAPSPNARHQG